MSGYDERAERMMIRNVSHRYGKDETHVQTLSNISLSAKVGDFVALVGQSGCGKSTLLNILSGLLAPTAGQVVFAGDSVPVISYLTQEDRLLPWRSVVHNVELPLELIGVGKTERRGVAHSLLTRVGLAEYANVYPSSLSGGMRQRAAIARALSTRPDILLLDEPFGALDAWNKKNLYELLLDLHLEYCATTILVTHDVFEAIALSSQIVTLAPRPGRIIETYDLGPTEKPRRHDDVHGEKFAHTYGRIRADLGLGD